MSTDTCAKTVSTEFIRDSFFDRLGPLRIGLCTFLLVGLAPSLLAIIEGKAFFSEQHPDFPFFGKFFVWPVAFLILFPLLNAVVVAFHHRIRTTFATAIDEGSVEASGNGVKFLKNYFVKKRSRLKLSLVGIAAALITFFYWTGPTLMFKLRTWVHGDYFGRSALFYVAMIVWFAEVFVILNSIVDFVFWVRFEDSIANGREGLTLHPMIFHPDRSAGLSGFGRVALDIYLFFVLLLLFVLCQSAEKLLSDPGLGLLGIWAKYKAVPISSALLVTILPFSFFLPLAPFYRVLREKRRSFIHALAPHLREIDCLMCEVDPKNEERLTEILKRRDLLQILYESRKQIPTWPFDVLTVRTFIISALAPFMAFIIQLAFS